MDIEAIRLKKWCDDNLTPVAWQRIVVQVSPNFRGSGISLKDLTDPSENLTLNKQQVEIIKKAIEATYSKEILISL